ncbi:hypothetical protein [Marinobacter vinifirmus]|uniref:Uncharacterized protein n=1 Tax=Marinobacter vinifirmus TaxID=355591 RepID=A0A558B367_9GAMM|nr:hypothetical protein [Marinobacter vinifirmus]TVT30964.1 MAG: hypothetical protein FHK81_16045 [Marinobacter vinifirmus]
MTDQNLNQLQEQLAQKKAALAKRFEEVARLTEQLEKEQAEVDALQQQLETLRKQEAAKPASSQPAAGPFRLELTNDEREKNRKHIELIRSSDLFDAEWYLETYADVAKSEKFADNPAAHYTLFGGFEGRKPCPEFDSSFYLRTNADVAKLKVNPLAHYLRFGRDEGRPFAPPVVAE